MQIKNIGPLHVVHSSHRLRIPEIGEASPSILAGILEAVERSGGKPCGNWIFIHHDLPKNGKDTHLVEFCLPVDPSVAVVPGFSVRTLEAFPCASTHYRGPMRKFFTQGVQPLVKEMKSANLRISSESREIYHRWLGRDSPDNEIEIQFGTVG